MFLGRSSVSGQRRGRRSSPRELLWLAQRHQRALPDFAGRALALLVRRSLGTQRLGGPVGELAAAPIGNEASASRLGQQQPTGRGWHRGGLARLRGYRSRAVRCEICPTSRASMRAVWSWGSNTPTVIAVDLSNRDKAWHDIYRIDIATAPVSFCSRTAGDWRRSCLTDARGRGRARRVSHSRLPSWSPFMLTQSLGLVQDRTMLNSSAGREEGPAGAGLADRWRPAACRASQGRRRPRDDHPRTRVEAASAQRLTLAGRDRGLRHRSRWCCWCTGDLGHVKYPASTRTINGCGRSSNRTRQRSR